MDLVLLIVQADAPDYAQSTCMHFVLLLQKSMPCKLHDKKSFAHLCEHHKVFYWREKEAQAAHPGAEQTRVRRPKIERICFQTKVIFMRVFHHPDFSIERTEREVESQN